LFTCYKIKSFYVINHVNSRNTKKYKVGKVIDETNQTIHFKTPIVLPGCLSFCLTKRMYDSWMAFGRWGD